LFSINVATIGSVVSIIVILITAAGYIIELEAKVNHLQNQIENHPLLAAYSEIQNRHAINALEKMLDSQNKKEDNYYIPNKSTNHEQ
jgi:hypothetical protein